MRVGKRIGPGVVLVAAGAALVGCAAPGRDDDVFALIGADSADVPAYRVVDEWDRVSAGRLTRSATLVVPDRSVAHSLAAFADWASGVEADRIAARTVRGRDDRFVCDLQLTDGRADRVCLWRDRRIVGSPGVTGAPTG